MTKLVESFTRTEVKGDFDVIVIGSGIGGLAAAAMLAKHANRRVLVLERHYTPGGFTHMFRRPGYDWDVGVHYVGDVGPGSQLRAIFDDVSDGGIEWADMGDVYDRVIIAGDRYDLPRGRSAFKDMLYERFPGQQTAIDDYLDAVRTAAGTSTTFFGSKALPGLLTSLSSPLLKSRFWGWSDRTTADVLNDLTEDPRLRAVLTAQFGDYGLPPSRSSFMMHALVANHYRNGGYYPVGGSSAIAEAIVPVIRRGGGNVFVNAEVAEILVADGRAVGVRMQDGRELRAPTIISDVGAVNTFGRLLPTQLGAGLLEQLEPVSPSVGHISLYLGLRGPASELDLPKHNLWIHATEDYDAAFAGDTPDPDARPALIYVSFPSAKDPDFERRHPGRATIDVIAMGPYEWFEQWAQSRWQKRPQEYEQLKTQLADQMLDVLCEQLPQVRDRIDVAELSTPLTTQHFTNHPTGAIYGLEHTPERFRQELLQPRTPVPGLFLTGQDVVTCGVAGALMAGVLTAASVDRRRLPVSLLGSMAGQVRSRLPVIGSR